MAKKTLAVAALALLPLFAACSEQPPNAVPAPVPSVTASETRTAEPAPEPTVATPAPSVATPSPSQTATPKPTLDPAQKAEAEAKQKAAAEAAAKRKAEAKAKAEAEAAAKKKAAEKASQEGAAKSAAERENAADAKAETETKTGTGTASVTVEEACMAETLSYGTKGACATQAMGALKAAGYYPGKVDATFGSGAANWTLHYQRSHGLPQTAKMDAATWAALKANKPAIGAFLAASCKGDGVNVCVHKASQTLYWVEDGKVVKTMKVRTAGWNQDSKGVWRIHYTPNGSYHVYDKEANPSSPRYGEGAMPYSTIFDANMYFHYSAGFAKVGYAGSSHGCVNIGSLNDAKWIMDNTPIGAKVVIY